MLVLLAVLSLRPTAALLLALFPSGLPPLWREKRLLETSSTLALKRMATRGGAHREEDGRRNRNKHIDKVKKDQDAALDRYVL